MTTIIMSKSNLCDIDQLGELKAQIADLKALEDKLKWQAYCVSGKALGVSKDGLILEVNGQKIVIKNHPRQGLIQTGDTVECIAMPMGAMSCITESGHTAYVRVFDHGQPLQK